MEEYYIVELVDSVITDGLDCSVFLIRQQCKPFGINAS